MENHLRIHKVFSYMTVQSCGRAGYMRFGVGESGALDSAALAEGCYLTGNDESFGCLEFLSSGGVFEYSGGNSAFVVNGGDFAVSLNGAPVLCGALHALVSGDIIEIGGVRAGWAGYLHIGGGIMTDEVLGSRSTNLRAALGGLEGRLLRGGDIVPVGEIKGMVRSGCGIMRDDYDISEIRVMAGSGIGYYDGRAIERFYSYEFRKTVGSDRLGSVLGYEGDVISCASGLGIISDAVVLGDVQIQGDGRVVVLLADRQPTGGYPRIATVIGVDLVRFVRLSVGAGFRFCEVSYDEARGLWLEELRRRESLGDYVVDLGGDLGSEYLLSRNLVSGVFF